MINLLEINEAKDGLWALSGIVQPGVGYATGGLQRCKELLSLCGIEFPPYKLGTINIKLDVPISTNQLQRTDRVHFIPQADIDKVDPGHNEDWSLIFAKQINAREVSACILRTSTNYWKDSVIEILAHDIGDAARIGQPITVHLKSTSYR